jgi:hypothetical protein
VLGPLRRYIALSGADRGLLARAYLWLTIAELALRLRLEGLSKWATTTDAAAAGPASVDTAAVLRARRYARWLRAASRYQPVRTECLHRSLALHWWLRREGVASRLQIGVRKEGGDLAAHAWVELDGQVVNDHPAAVARFTPLMNRATR